MGSPVVVETYNESLKPLSWLIGCWTAAEARVFYPTMDSVLYTEEMEFLPNDQQPVLHYNSKTFHAVTKNLLHTETGYLRILPGTKTVALMVGHHFGLSELSEGEVGDQELLLKSKDLSSMSFVKGSHVTEVHRQFILKDLVLHSKIKMATTTQNLQDHSIAVYNRKKD